jgi:hypothetical protein
MRTTVIAFAIVAAFATSTRAHAQGVNLAADTPAVLLLTHGVPTVLTLGTLVIDSVLISQLARGKAPSRGLAVTGIAFSTLSGAWSIWGLTTMSTPNTWKVVPGVPLAFAAGLVMNVSTLVFSIVTLFLPRAPPVAVMPMVVQSGGGASIALRW